MRRGYMVLRNCLCGLLAVGLIVFGTMGRARRRALGGDVVTPIYFHKPNRRLFARCMRWLIKHGYSFITTDDLLEILYCGKTPPRGAVWLSFDDGCREILEAVLPLVRQHKIPVALFIPTGIVEGDGVFPWSRGGTPGMLSPTGAPARHGVRDAVTVAELKEIAGYPEVTIGSHTVNHAVTPRLTEEKARFELGESKRTLEAWARADVKCFAYPKGRFDGREKRFLKEFGYHLAATTQNAFITRETDPYELPRFSIGDEISFPEAICNMVGVWRPAIDPVIRFLQRWRRILPAVGGLGNLKHSEEV